MVVTTAPAWRGGLTAQTCPAKCLETGVRGPSGQHAPSPAGAKQGPAPGPVSALLPSMGVLHVLRSQGEQEYSIKWRPALMPLHAQWMEPGALGGHGLPVTHAWGSPIEAGCAAILPSLTEANLVLGAISRVALVGTAPPCVQIVEGARISYPVGSHVLIPARICPLAVHASQAQQAVSLAVGVPQASFPRMGSVCFQLTVTATSSLEPWGSLRTEVGQ